MTLSSSAVGIIRQGQSTFPARLAQALEPVLKHRLIAKGHNGTRRLLAKARHPRKELLERLARLVQLSELTERIGKGAPSYRIVRAALYGKARDLCCLLIVACQVVTRRKKRERGVQDHIVRADAYGGLDALMAASGSPRNRRVTQRAWYPNG